MADDLTSGPGFVFERRGETFIVPADARDDGYDTPEEAVLHRRRRVDAQPTLVAVRHRGEQAADVEVDLGRHPADRIVFHCECDEGRWWVRGSQSWFDETPEIVVFATPKDNLGLYIDVSRHGYQLMITGYDFASTHASHHRTLPEAQEYAAEKTGIADLDWQPWPTNPSQTP